MKKATLILTLILATGSLFAQKKTTTSATVSFDATTSLDNLPKADNKTVIAVFDTKSGMVQFEAKVKDFTFSNPTMQEHFNGDRWMNSEAFPTFTFKGKIADQELSKLSADGTYQVNVEGILTVKGKEQKVKVPGTVVVKGDQLSASANFPITLADFGITGVPIDAGKVAKNPKISVSADFN